MRRFKEQFANHFPSGLRTLILNSGYFFATSILGIAVSFISFPVFVALLSKADFGILAFFTALNMIVAQFSILSLTNYYIIRSRELDTAGKRKLLLDLLIFNFFWNLMLMTVGMILVYFYFTASGTEIPYFPNVPIMFIILISQSFISLRLVAFRIEGAGRNFFFTEASQLLGNVFFSIMIVWLFDSGATGKLLGIATSNTIIAISLWFVMAGKRQHSFSFLEVKRGLKEMLPLTLASFLHSTAPSADVIILERLNNLPGLGVYNVGKQVATFVTTACTSVFQAFEPKFYEDFRDKPVRESKNFRVFVLIIFIVVGLYFIFSDTIIKILTLGKFQDSLEYSNILVVQALILPVIQAIQVKFYIRREVKLIAAINLIGSFVLLGLVFVLTSSMLYTGAAIAFVVSALIQIVLLFIALARQRDD